jgi:hypothetical protein
MRGSAKHVGYSTEKLEALAVEKLACEPGMYGDGLAACEPLQRRSMLAASRPRPVAAKWEAAQVARVLTRLA